MNNSLTVRLLEKISRMQHSEQSDKKIWGGRFTEKPSSIAEEISESISYDHQLYREDIAGSRAHARMLAAQNIITPEALQNILNGLKQIESEIEAGQMTFLASLEDIHMHIESRLTQLIGDDGKRLHTGRSRNDQVATDTHLYLKKVIKQQSDLLHSLLQCILDLAEKNRHELWAGYTHTQIAQPVRLGHWLMVWFWGFLRDARLLKLVFEETDISPLGAAAMAGANYPIDREMTAHDLGFSEVYQNSMDAVSDRDYQLSYHFFVTRLFLRTSRLCEDLILYSTAEFGYVKMGDAVTTGSSIMPQKKNPDIAELLRGKSGRVTGNFMALLVNLKSLPMTYNRDLQEDKVYLFDSVEQVNQALLGLNEILKNIQFFPEKVKLNLNRGFAQATDIADYLVKEYKLPFRETHEIAGRLVALAESQQTTLDKLSPVDIKSVVPEGIVLPADLFEVEKSPERKNGTGSVNKEAINKQILSAREKLKSMFT